MITDFWPPYDAVVCAEKQKCWPHLLRDAASVDEKNPDHQEWKSFSRRLVGVYRDAKKLHPRRSEMDEPDYDKLSPASVIRLAVGFPRTHTSSRLDLTGFSLGSTGARLPI